jgi:hypothetical protein
MSTKPTAKGASSVCESSDAIKEQFLQYLPQLNSKQLNFFASITRIMVDDKKDVYFIVCAQSKTIYQGYSINRALESLSTLHSTSQSHRFLCLHPNNRVSVLSENAFYIGGVL